MFKKVNKTEEITANTVPEKNASPATGELTHTALSVIFDTKVGLWGVASVKFNPKTGETGEYSFKPEGHERSAAMERFKIMAATLDMVG